MPLRPGLVSVSLRALPALQVVELAAQAGLASIEWGGDVHAPHGDLATARDLGAATRRAGLAVSGYGSYYRAGFSGTDGLPFDRVLATAVALGAPRIRVWAGISGSATTTADQRAAVVADLRRVVALSSAAGVTVTLEHHDSTLTDTSASSRALLDAVPGLAAGWQPYADDGLAQRLDDLAAHRDRLAVLHVFQWQRRSDGLLERQPLAAGADLWLPCLAMAAGLPIDALLEFLPDDDPARLPDEAATLRRWLASDLLRA